MHRKVAIVCVAGEATNLVLWNLRKGATANITGVVMLRVTRVKVVEKYIYAINLSR